MRNHLRTSGRRFALLLFAAHAASAYAQTAAIEIRVTGRHTITSADTPELARQLAQIDGQRAAWREAAARLRTRADVTALQLKPAELDAYTAVIVEAEAVSSTASSSATKGDMLLPMRARVDAAAAVSRMRAMHRDQDAAYDLVEAWKRLQQAQTPAAFDAVLMTARATAALARTEERPVGGRASTNEGRERAKQLAEAALAASPNSAEPHTVLGDLLIDAQQPEAAEAEFRKALAIANTSAWRTKLAEALRLQGKFDEAVAALREALQLETAFAPAHAGLGLALQGQRNSTEAVAAYREALRLDPDLIDAHNGLAVLLASQGRLDEAVVEFREMTRVDPDSAIGYYNLAIALADLDRDVESAAALREVIRINPNHYNAHYNLGELFRLEGKFDESAKQFREYLRLAPAVPQTRRNIERATAMVKRFEDQ
jgi:tetratricopeptide (TPR) repeat protein